MASRTLNVQQPFIPLPLLPTVLLQASELYVFSLLANKWNKYSTDQVLRIQAHSICILRFLVIILNHFVIFIFLQI